jgi:protein phosphatase
MGRSIGRGDSGAGGVTTLAPGADRAPRASPTIPADALVLLVGPAGSGKSTFAAAHFASSELLSSDAFRFMVSGDASDQDATTDAFRVLHAVARARLRRGLRCVVDATNLSRGGRRGLLSVAARAGRPAIAVLFDIPLEVGLARNDSRVRQVPEDVVRRHHGEMPLVRAQLSGEGYAAILVVDVDGAVRAG